MKKGERRGPDDTGLRPQGSPHRHGGLLCPAPSTRSHPEPLYSLRTRRTELVKPCTNPLPLRFLDRRRGWAVPEDLRTVLGLDTTKGSSSDSIHRSGESLSAKRGPGPFPFLTRSTARSKPLLCITCYQCLLCMTAKEGWSRSGVGLTLKSSHLEWKKGKRSSVKLAVSKPSLSIERS